MSVLPAFARQQRDKRVALRLDACPPAVPAPSRALPPVSPTSPEALPRSRTISSIDSARCSNTLPTMVFPSAGLTIVALVSVPSLRRAQSAGLSPARPGGTACRTAAHRGRDEPNSIPARIPPRRRVEIARQRNARGGPAAPRRASPPGGRAGLHRHRAVAGNGDERGIGAVLEEPPDQIGEKFAVAADRRIDAAGRCPSSACTAS